MSRKDIVGRNYTISFGVDHVIGAFVQLWRNPSYDQDCAFLVIDSDGVRYREKIAGVPIPGLELYLIRIQQRFDEFKTTNHGCPNIEPSIVIRLADIVGEFGNISAEVHRTFGDNI